MIRLSLVLESPVPAGVRGDVGEKLVYAWDRIRSHELSADGTTIALEIADEADAAEAERRVRAIVKAMAKRQPAVERKVAFEHRVAPRHSAPVEAELARAGIVTMTQPGLATLTGEAVEVMEGLDRRFTEMSRTVFGVKRHHYPSMIAKASLDRVSYFGSFPQHATFALPFREDLQSIDAVSKDQVAYDSPAFLDLLRRPAQVLVPALCFNTYVYFQNRPLPEPTVITTRGRCFRYESRNMAALERLWEFEMREIVFLGPRDWVAERRMMAFDAAARFLVELGLDGWIETANDPFFLNNFAAQRFFQLAGETKHELRLSLPYAEGRSVAAASFNLHLEFFGKSFGIAYPREQADGFVHTGCVGFGLERWVWALFAQLGPSISAWPSSVRASLGLA